MLQQTLQIQRVVDILLKCIEMRRRSAPRAPPAPPDP